jgi:hypothetical protein
MIYDENFLLQQAKFFQNVPDNLREFAKKNRCLNREMQEHIANRTRVPHEQMTFSTPGGKIIDQHVRDEKYLSDPRSEWNMCVYGTTAKGYKGLLDSVEEQKTSAAMVCDVHGWDCGLTPLNQTATESVGEHVSEDKPAAFGSMQMMASSLSAMCVVVIVLGVMLARK